MKKRILSLALVLVLVFSLVPVNASAASVTVTITQQPVNAFARVGDEARFSISATSSEGTLNYIWVDTDKANFDKLNSWTNDLANLITGDTIADNLGDSVLGQGSQLVISDVQKDLNIACVVYVFELGTSFPILLNSKFGLKVSDTVKLTINQAPVCANHEYGINLEKINAIEPSCAREGRYEYYACMICGECYADPFGQTRTSPEACVRPKLSSHLLEYRAAKPGDCDNESTLEYWECTECGKLFSDALGTKETTKFIVEHSGTKDPNNHAASNIEHYPAKAATCDSKGNCEYWYCKGCHTYFKNAELSGGNKDNDYVELPKDPTNHLNLVETKARPATCTTDGSMGYWYCTGCRDYFSDPAGLKEIHESDAKIPKLGHNYQWSSGSTESGFAYHQKECTRCGAISDTEAHYGGTATCVNKATCAVCGAEYGTVDPHNHVNTELQGVIRATVDTQGFSGNLYCHDCQTIVKYGETTPKLCIHTITGSGVVKYHAAVAPTCSEQTGAHAGNIEYWECTECGKCWTDPQLVNEIGNASVSLPIISHYVNNSDGSKSINDKVCVAKYDTTWHWKVCKYCDAELEGTRAVHRMTTDVPTCCSSNYCVDCGYDVGNFDLKNHKGGTEVINAREPEGTVPGYTGDTKCLGCGQIIKTGEPYFEVCPNGCRESLMYVEGKPVGCSEDGIKAHYKCSLCGHLYKDEYAATPVNESELVIKSTGHDIHPSLSGTDQLLSTDTLVKILTSKGFAGLIGGLIDSTGKMDFEKALDYVHVCDLDHCSDDHYHWLGCQRCGKTLRELAPELGNADLKVNTKLLALSDRQPHYGGSATCQERAVCAECGDYYGELAPHDFYENNKCKTCPLKVTGCKAPSVKYSMDVETGMITLSWNEVDDAKSYEVKCAKTKGGTYELVYEGEDLSFTPDFSGYGKSYYYTVRARGVDNSYGKECDPVYCASKCIAPVAKGTNVASTGYCKITWDKVPGAVKYEIYRATSKTGTYKKMYTATSTSYTNSSATHGGTYYYKVRAIGSDGVASAYSNIVLRTCDLAKPVVTIGNNSTTGKITLKWAAVDGATKYEIWRATSKNGTFTKQYTTTSTSYTNTTSVVGKTYYYKVKAICGNKTAADSAFSDVKSRTCDCAKPVVKIGISGTHPYLKWEPISGADRYIVYRATSKNGTYTKMYTTTKNYYTNTSAVSKTMYYYKVVAVSDKSTSANSAYSSIVNIRAW